MKKMIALIIALFVVTITGQAQSTYKSDIDLRVSDGYYDEVAASLKTFLRNPAAIELNIGFRDYGYIGYSWFNLDWGAWIVAQRCISVLQMPADFKERFCYTL